MAKYAFEVWNAKTTHTMDITHLVQNVRFSIERNEAERLDFDMDLSAFEAYCESINEHPVTALRPYSSDIKVKRNGEYLFGAQVAELFPRADVDGATVAVSCDGFLSLLTDRYVSGTYSQIDGADIAWSMINVSNFSYSADPTLSDTGITRGVAEMSGFLRDRTYDYQNVREGIINLTDLASHKFDFDFTHDRKFNTYQKKGSDRSEITISYPANGQGIGATSMELPHIARGTLYNWIEGIGSGFGEEALKYSVASTASFATFGVRQRPVNFNDISVMSTLQEKTYAELVKRYDVLRLPKFIVPGSQFDLNIIKVGDRINTSQTKYKLLAVGGMMRIERLEVALDDNFEESIAVTVDTDTA